MSIPYELVVAEDLNLGNGSVTVTNPAGGTMTGSKIGVHTLHGTSYLAAHDFSGANAGAQISSAIAALPASGGTVDARGLPAGTLGALTLSTSEVTLLLGQGTYTTTGITITGTRVKIKGLGQNSTKIQIATGGTFGIKIVHPSGNTNTFDSQVELEDFGVTTAVTGVAVKGIFFDNAQGKKMIGVIVDLTNNTAANTYAFHGRNYHDSRVYNCEFNSGTGANADGCRLESLTPPSAAVASNGNSFFSTRFQNSGGWGYHNISGQDNRHYGSHFQSNVLGGRFEDKDSSGNGTVGGGCWGCWYEFNTGDSLKIDGGGNVTESGSFFTEGTTTNAINMVGTGCTYCTFSALSMGDVKPITIVGNWNTFIDVSTNGNITNTGAGNKFINTQITGTGVFTESGSNTSWSLGRWHDTILGGDQALNLRYKKSTAGAAADNVKLGFYLPTGDVSPSYIFTGAIGGIIDGTPGLGTVAGGIGFWTGNQASTALRGQWDSVGRLGVGRVSPDIVATFHVQAANAANPVARFQGGTAQSGNLLDFYDVNGASLSAFDKNSVMKPLSIIFANRATYLSADGMGPVYCSDCTVANPCAGGGTGAFMIRVNATYICN